MLRRLANLLTGGYGALLCAYLLLRFWRGERSNYVDFLNHVMPGLAMPVLPLFLLALVRGDRARMLLFLPGMLTLLAQYDTRNRATASPAIVTEKLRQPITLLTFNLQGQRINIARLLKLTVAFEPDILCFQELTAPVAEALTAALHEQYPYEQVSTQGVTIHGVGSYSRFPLRDCELIKGDHGHLRATVVMGANGREFALYNVHPSPPGGLRNLRGFQPRYRRDEIETILARAGQETLPIVLAGDFNLTDRSADYRRLVSGYVDSFREAGFGARATFPDLGGIAPLLGGGWFGGLRLDYVFHSPDIQPVNAQVIPDAAGSDHRPVLVKLLI